MNPDFEGRVVVVANRLPITIKPQPNGDFEYSMSSGGLVSGLRSLAKAVDFKWFGWPGIDVHRNDKDAVRRELQNRFNAVPIFLNSEVAEKHYNGFSSESHTHRKVNMVEELGKTKASRLRPLASATSYAR